MSTYGMSDRAILREIGRRLKRRRLEKNISQQELGNVAGLNRTTIGEIERGAAFSMLTLVRILRALDALDGLDAFLPDPGISPLELAKMKGKERRRASRISRKPTEAKKGDAEW